MITKFFLGLGYLIPKNLLSYLVGVGARWQIPSFLRAPVLQGFVKLFSIDMSEADRPLLSYQSIEEVFCRSLRPGERSVEAELCSPADGTLTISAAANNGVAVQAKGLTYRLDELVFGESTTEINLAWYTTVYLAPHNYHRVHSPVGGRLCRVRYFPGQLWPVNKPFVKYLPRLFVRNERLIFDIELQNGGMVYVVMVGALNVGRIKAACLPDFVSNSLKRQFGASKNETAIEPTQEITAGSELGTFMLGSTVVVVYDQAAVKGLAFTETTAERSVRMGEVL